MVGRFRQSSGSVDVLSDAGRVLTFHTATRETWRTNYLHPICATNGQCLTEDCPADHPHHRGVFFAWRRILIDGVAACDGWSGRNFAHRSVPARAKELPSGIAELAAASEWLCAGMPIARESLRIAVFPDRDGVRGVRIDMQLRSLVDGLSIAGTDDEKGYGGPAIRFAHPSALRFASGGRAIEPAVGAVATGPEVTFWWDPHPEGFPARVTAAATVDGTPWTRWVLRRSLSMQNAAFPGRVPFAVPRTHGLQLSLTLRIEAA